RIELLGVLAEEARELGFELEPHARLRRRGPHTEPLAQKVADRPVGEGLRVRDRASFDEANLVAVARAHFPDEARLADAGLAHDRDDRAAALDEPLHDALEDAHLEGAPDDPE